MILGGTNDLRLNKVVQQLSLIQNEFYILKLYIFSGRMWKEYLKGERGIEKKRLADSVIKNKPKEQFSSSPPQGMREREAPRMKSFAVVTIKGRNYEMWILSTERGLR